MDIIINLLFQPKFFFINHDAVIKDKIHLQSVNKLTKQYF